MNGRLLWPLCNAVRSTLIVNSDIGLRSVKKKTLAKNESCDCEVPVEEGKQPDGRKEFSVTFYDLDGHSKITQDDIAGLVRSIYSALNDSIAVPHGGKKTIKVHLTVTSSEKANPDSDQECNNNNNNKTPKTNCKLRKNLNVTIQENLKHECESSPAKHGSKFEQIRTPNRLSFRGCRNRSPEIVQDCTASPLHHRKKWREQAARRAAATTTHNRPDLCELLQANMEENNVSCCRAGRAPHQHQHQHNHHHSQRCSHNQLIDPDCPVLPLYQCGEPGGCERRKPLRSESICLPRKPSCEFSTPPALKRHNSCRAKPQQNHLHQHHHHHHHGDHNNHSRSRSHDISQNLFNYHLLSESDERLTAIQAPSLPPAHQFLKCNNEDLLTTKEDDKNNDDEEETLELLLGYKSKNNNNLNASIHHQLKHRNREQEHARAMAQVISWLERDIGMDKSSPKKLGGGVTPTTTTATAVAADGGATPTRVKKHEHHHVHHHYLHYAKETPIIV